MGKRCFAQLTWIDSGDTIFKKEKKKKKKKKEEKKRARLKTQKDSLGKN